MMTNLVRATTYFDPVVLTTAKKRAIDEKKSLYVVLNEKLRESLGLPAASKTVVNKPFRLEDVFGPPFKAGVKKKNLTRTDFYDLDKL